MIYGSDDFFTCIHNSDKEKAKIDYCQRDMASQYSSGTLQVDSPDGEPLKLIKHPVPQSPDDPEHFPREFLDSLKEEGITDNRFVGS